MQTQILESLIFSVVLVVILVADVRATTNESTQKFGVGFTRSIVADPMGGDMQYSLWYPTRTSNGTVEIGPFQFPGTRDAEPAEGVFGLVVLSHGHAGTDLGHRNIAISLAQAGIVAAAPLHPRDNFRDSSGISSKIVWEGRPKQITAVINHLLGDEKWTNKIDPEKIGAFGFSMGGYTVLSLLGAQPDFRRVSAHCERHQKEDAMCNLAGVRAVSNDGDLLNADLSDERICAAVLADPVSVMFTQNEIADISNAHVKIYLPEHADQLAARFHGYRVFQTLRQHATNRRIERVVVANARHFSFLAPFPEAVAREIPELVDDAEGFDRAAFQKRFAADVSEFFVSTLAACDSASAAKGADSSSEPKQGRDAMEQQKANMRGSDFNDVNLSGTRFNNVNFYKTTFSNVDMGEVVFTASFWGGAEIKDSNLSGMKIDGVLVTDLLEAYEKR